MNGSLPPSSERLARAGWLSFANALITVPLFLFSLILARDDSYGARACQSALTLVSTLLFIYVMLTLVDYLNCRHQFHRVNMPVKVLVWVNICLSVFSMLGLVSQPLQEAGGLFAMVLIVPSGFMQALFGYRLRRLANPLGGRLKPYCLLNIVTGICLAVVILIPVGIVTSVAGDVILGRILLAAAHE